MSAWRTSCAPGIESAGHLTVVVVGQATELAKDERTDVTVGATLLGVQRAQVRRREGRPDAASVASSSRVRTSTSVYWCTPLPEGTIPCRCLAADRRFRHLRVLQGRYGRCRRCRGVRSDRGDVVRGVRPGPRVLPPAQAGARPSDLPRRALDQGGRPVLQKVARLGAVRSRRYATIVSSRAGHSSPTSYFDGDWFMVVALLRIRGLRPRPHTRGISSGTGRFHATASCSAPTDRAHHPVRRPGGRRCDGCRRLRHGGRRRAALRGGIRGSSGALRRIRGRRRSGARSLRTSAGCCSVRSVQPPGERRADHGEHPRRPNEEALVTPSPTVCCSLGFPCSCSRRFRRRCSHGWPTGGPGGIRRVPGGTETPHAARPRRRRRRYVGAVPARPLGTQPGLRRRHSAAEPWRCSR